MSQRKIGIVSSFIRRLAAKAVSIADFPTFFASARDEIDSGTTGSGVVIDKPYQQSTWVYAAVSLIAQNVSRTPFRHVTLDGKIIKSGVEVSLAKRPNPKQTGRQFFSKLMTRLLLDGHVFIERAGLKGNRPTEVHVRGLRDLRADIRRDANGQDFAWRWIRKSNEEPLIPGDEVVEWKLDNPYDDVYGLSPLLSGWLAVYSDVATGVFNRSFFENGAQPGTIFSTDNEAFTQDQAEKAEKRWNAVRRGARNANRAAFLGNGLKPFNVSSSHRDMEFPTLKSLSKGEILAIYHVPDSLLGVQAPASGVTIGATNRKPDEENFYLNTVMPWGEQVAEFWNLAVDESFGAFRGSFDFSAVPVLQDRQLDRAKEGREWVNAGIPVNEVNRIFDLGFQEQEHGDEFWVPGNMVPARLLLDGPISSNEAGEAA